MNQTPPGPGFDVPKVASYVFMAFGAAIVAMGVSIVFDDPGGFAAIAFGLVFIGVGFVCRKVFAVPEGKKEIVVSGHTARTSGWGGTGTRSQSVLIRVDEDATEAEVDAAREEWLRERFAQRPDWAEGLVLSNDARFGGLAKGAAIGWTVLTLAVAGASLIWNEIALLPLGMGVVALLLIANAVRVHLRRKKFGESRFRLEATPAALGGRLKGEVLTGVSRRERLEDGFAVTLACVHRWEETHGSGSDRTTRQRSDTLWQAEARHPGRTSASNDKVSVPIDLALPEDQPETSLGGGSSGIHWELRINAAMPGLDYAAAFELPVLAPETARLLGG